jgi:DNA-binding NarL/FixJ family response regulator
MSIRVLIADDHQLLRAGIVALLRDLPDVDVVGEAANGADTLRLVDDLNPDLLLLDVVMPGMSGIEVLEQLQQRSVVTPRVIMLTMHASEEHVLRALRLGASGYLLKDAAPDELGQALLAVARGENWLSSAVSKKVISGYVARAGGEETVDALTVRQHEVLKMMAQGMSTKEIGAALNLSVKTIETYRAQIMDRLDIHDLAGLVRYAIRNGIVPL